MARGGGISTRIEASGLRETIDAFRDLPKDASAELRAASLRLSTALATIVAGAARSSSPQSALVASTVKAVRDRIPSVEAGGSKLVGRNRKPADKIVFGANFGARVLRQFRPHRGGGTSDYWFFSTIEASKPVIDREWNAAADDIIHRFGSR